jgi:hypothetical protein
MSTPSSIMNGISENLASTQQSITGKMNEFSNIATTTVTSSFGDSNGILAKFAFFIIIVIGFMMLLHLGISLITYFSQPSSKIVLINGSISGNVKTIITQDPKSDNNIITRRSNNQKNGIEFTWSVWLLINDASNNLNKYQPIFVKGGNSYNSNNISTVSNGPGVYLYPGSSPNPNTLHIIMDTIANYASTLTQTIPNVEIVDISNIPLKKWFLLTIRCENKYLDVYVNGQVVFRRNLTNVPLQNYDSISVCDSGGFNGTLSNLIYYSYALNAMDINAITLAGPNLTNSNPTAPVSNGSSGSYLSSSWYIQ